MKRALLLLGVIAFACGRSPIYRYRSFSDGGMGSMPDASMMLPDGSVPDAGKPCIPGTLQLTRATPVTTFIIDASSSMKDRFDMSETKWDALINALTSTLPPQDQQLQMGTLIFPIPGASALACLPPGAADLTPALGHAQAIIDLLDSRDPSGSTPTAGAIDVAAASVMGVRAATASRALVLATDGEPNCNGSLDPHTCTCIGTPSCTALRCLDDARTIDRISHYADAGLPTYVIGIATEMDATFIDVLNRMAIAGGKPRQGASTEFYGVTNQAELTQAFQTINAQVGACVFLSASVPNTDEGIAMFLNGEMVPENTGWIWTDRSNGEVTLLGSFCDEVAANNTLPLSATISCDVPK
jgi:hypothetical protein